MDKQHVKGAADKAKGSIKDTVGQAIGSTRLQAERKADKAKGGLRTALGDIKDFFRGRR